MKQTLSSTVKKAIAGLFIIVLFGGCFKDPAPATCTFDECAIKASASEIASVQNYLTANSITATQHCSGLFYRIDTQGSGAQPGPCNGVYITYEGKLTNGTTFDQSTTTVGFSLVQLITAWRIGLPMLKTGGTIYLYVPPSLGYGSTAVGPIPANSILIFKITLTGVY